MEAAFHRELPALPGIKNKSDINAQFGHCRQESARLHRAGQRRISIASSSFLISFSLALASFLVRRGNYPPGVM
jgi:hypothetical protein